MACDGCQLKLMKYLQICADEAERLKFLFAHSVIPHEMRCPTCDRMIQINKALNFRCQRTCTTKMKKKTCKFNSSAFNDTFFHNISVPIDEVMQFVGHWLCRKSPRQLFLECELGWSKRTIVNWASSCREVTVHWAISQSQKIGGPGIMVELYNANFEKRKNQEGRVIRGSWVFSGVERKNMTRNFFTLVPDRQPETLLNLITEYIHPGSVVCYDTWNASDCQKREGFEELKVNHSINFVDPESCCHIQNISHIWRDVTVDIPKTGRREEHFQGYLSEYLFKKVHPNFRVRYHEFFKAVASLYVGQK